jgi:hypothetical protein
VAPCPRELGAAEVTVGGGGGLKVAVIPELALRVMAVDEVGQGLVVPPQFVAVMSPVWTLQPANVDPPVAVAVMRYVSPFLKAKVPVAVQFAVFDEIEQPAVWVSGVSPVIRANATVPVPVPAFV